MNVIEVEFATPEYDETVRLRYDILRKPINKEFTEEQLAQEFSDIHVAAYDEAWVLRGCLILTPKDKKIVKMRQVAVEAASQGKGVGRVMVEASEKMARIHGFERIELHARDVAVPFYKKLNYEIVGEVFQEVDIDHFKMVKNLV